MNRRVRRLGFFASLAAASIALTSCAGLSAFGEELSRAWQGVPATFTSYDQAGNPIDEVHGTSFRVARDTRFDTTEVGSDGKTSTTPGEVLLISIGDSHISHVGSSACLVQDGLDPIGDAADYVKFSNSQPGMPWLNDLREKFQNQWHGRSKTILIRSQDGKPISVFAGNAVEVFATDVPKSTWFRVDGKMLWCYRVDYTTYDTKLLSSP